jgi:hypothetical protein
LSQTPGTPGAIAARQYNCGNPAQTIQFADNVNFVDSGIGFGSTLPTGSSVNFGAFLLQPGIYQAHLSISNVSATPAGQSLALFNAINGFTPLAVWLIQNGINLSGDRLISVTAANTDVIMRLNFSSTPNPPSPTATINGTNPNAPCLLILTQLQ